MNFITSPVKYIIPTLKYILPSPLPLKQPDNYLHTRVKLSPLVFYVRAG